MTRDLGKLKDAGIKIYPIHLSLSVRVVRGQARLGPAGGDQHLGAFRLGPQLLGDEGHEGMEQDQDAVQHPGRGGPGLGGGRFVVSLEHGLGEFQVPVAERAPGELIEGIGGLVELVGAERPVHLAQDLRVRWIRLTGTSFRFFSMRRMPAKNLAGESEIRLRISVMRFYQFNTFGLENLKAVEMTLLN